MPGGFARVVLVLSIECVCLRRALPSSRAVAWECRGSRALAPVPALKPVLTTKARCCRLHGLPGSPGCQAARALQTGGVAGPAGLRDPR